MNALLIDVGNTTICFAIYKNSSLYKKDVIKTNLKNSESFYVKKLNKYGINFEKVGISSVVPSVTSKLKIALKKVCGFDPVIVDYKSKVSFKNKIKKPEETGADLICDLQGASKYENDILIIDLGTATKFLYLGKNKNFDYALILPGIKSSIKYLSKGTALLPNIKLDSKVSIKANNTIDAMNSGVIIGHIEAIKGIVERFKNEISKDLKVIITGGNSLLLKGELNKEFIYEENLLLDGLYSITMRN